MPQLAVAAAGAAIGSVIPGVGAAVGWAVGSFLGSWLFAPDSQAPKADPRAPKLQMGAKMPRLYGTVRVALSPRWQSDWRATEASAGGKGGGGSDYYTYSCDLLAWIADVAGQTDVGQVKGWTRLWWNGELVATRRADSAVESILASDGTGKWDALAFHDGNAAQLPWEVYEAALGAENADAHRRIACMSFENLQTGTWSNLPLLEAEVYTNGLPAGLEELAPLRVNDWIVSGNAPVHGDGDTTYDDLRLMSNTNDPDDPIAGTFTTLADVLDAVQDALPGYQNVLAYTSSANELPNVFSGGEDLSDDPEYVYVWIGRNPALVIEASGGTWDTALGTNLPIYEPPYDDDAPGYLVRAGFEAPGLLGNGLVKGVWSTAVEPPPETYDATLFHMVNDYPPSYPSTGPESGYFPSVVSSRLVRVRLKRVPFVPDGYEIEAGTFKALQKLEYASGILWTNGLGPVLRDNDPDYSDEDYWEAAALAAGVGGSYGVDYPVIVSEAGVLDYDAVDPLPVDLADIVAAECLRSGLTADDIEVSGLAGIEVRGFIAQGTAREAIEDLMAIFHFYAVCSDKLYFRLLDATSIASIPFVDSGAGVGQPGEPFTGVERGNDLEVPSEVVVVSPNPSADYDAGAETSDRLVTAGRRKLTLQSAVVMSPAERKGRANAMVLDARVAMHTARLAVDDSYAMLEPGDVVTPTDDEGNGYTMRIVRESYADGVHDFEVRLFDRQALTLEAVTSDTYSPVIDLAGMADTQLVLLDTGLLRDEDDGPHLLAALRPAESGRWPGASVYRSVDGGAFSAIASASVRSVIGTASTELADFSGWTWDEAGTVTVDIGSATLTSSTRAAMQADSTINVAALGTDGRWEILRYRTATLLAPGVYTLSGLLRGLRGTEAHRGSHEVGDTFVKLAASMLQRISVSAGELGLTRYWKGVTVGQQVSSVSAQSVSSDGVALEPWAPTTFRVARDGANNATLSWQRRTRLAVRHGGPGGSYVPLGEVVEAYEVDVYADDTFAAVVRTIAAGSETASYTAAEQTADGLTPGDPIYARIYQLSAVVGRGFPLEATA